jgi:hypothetical protein
MINNNWALRRGNELVIALLFKEYELPGEYEAYDKMEKFRGFVGAYLRVYVRYGTRRPTSTVPHDLEIELGAEDQGRSAAWE